MGVFHLLVDYRRDIQQENTPSTAENKQKGNHGNRAPGSSSLLLVEEVTAPSTGSALQLFQRLELNGAVSCEQTLSGVYCVWTEAFFAIAIPFVYAFSRMRPRGAPA